ncbi:aldo/keto reductase [Kineosporia sp. NBRC 101731]|uniref:aldo/keto reductase n=1 Tax=Kineosporia sp. NBRC 101731 TaxID=3032199 RepID=UPI0024A5ADE3|nr:aldo/keto reductase [Kineosporia sp. NBRC 101731]GLY29837.1 hypothetical protein Kisp02_32020 [Kineosporia sp. NBRC 101731]
MPIGWDDVDPQTALAALVRALELGINLFDTADVYGHGTSERLLGRLLVSAEREDVVICTKGGFFAEKGEHPYEPQRLQRQILRSLTNLGTDYIDCYFLHSSNFGPNDQYLQQALELLRGLRDMRVIRAIGMRAPHTFAEEWARGEGPTATRTARWLHLFHMIQPQVIAVRYNLLSSPAHEGETDIFAFARRHDVGVLIKQALGQGRLVRNYSSHPTPVFSAQDHRSADRLQTRGTRRGSPSTAPTARPFRH